MINMLFLSTYWGPHKGGINVVNFDLVNNLIEHKTPNIGQIFCVVPFVSKDKIRDGEAKGLKFITFLNQEISENLLEKMSVGAVAATIKNRVVFSEFEKYVIIGHDRFTGELANELAKEFHSDKVQVKSLVFHHMDHSSYEFLKRNSSSHTINEKNESQKRILQQADIIYAVGPKLKDSADKKLEDRYSYEYIPGLVNETLFNVSPRPTNKTIDAITFGRHDEDTDVIKQLSLAVVAFSKAKNEGSALNSDSKITVLGIKEGSEIQAKTHFNHLIKKYISKSLKPSFVPLSYDTDRESLFKKLTACDFCLMLSVHEGFGLVGYEAIAVLLPLILSENSGLYEFLNKEQKSFAFQNNFFVSIPIIGGGSDDKINSADLDKVVDAILEITKNLQSYKQNTALFKRRLSKKYSWKKIVEKFLYQVTYEFDVMRKYEDSIVAICSATDDDLPENIVESDRLAQESRELYIKGDINNSYIKAVEAFQNNRNNAYAISRIGKTAVRLNLEKVLFVLSCFSCKSQSDDYIYFMMQYKRAILGDYDEVINLFERLKNKSDYKYTYEVGAAYLSKAYDHKNVAAHRVIDYLNQALQMLKTSLKQAYEKNKDCWWIEITIMILERRLELNQTLDRENVISKLNNVINENPGKLSARIYRLLFYMVLKDDSKLNECIERENDYYDSNTSFPLDFILTIEKQLGVLYQIDNQNEKKYSNILHSVIDKYKIF